MTKRRKGEGAELFYLVLGIFVAVAFGALLKKQQTRQHPQPPQEAAPQEGVQAAPPEAPQEDRLEIGAPEVKAPEAPAEEVTPQPEAIPAPQEGRSIAILQEEVVPCDTVLAAKPISSPNAVGSATYSAAAPATLGEDSPYAYGSSAEPPKKAKPSASLLRWCGRTGSLQVGDLVILGPVTYWSDGPSSVKDPCCIDVVLPVEYPQEGASLPADGAASYAEMTPLQRGVYLTWLAGGRIQPPLHLCYPSLWLYGLERRVIADRLDMGLCLAEAFRLLPLIRWDAVLTSLIHFITWLAAKIWLSEDELLSFCKKLLVVPGELLIMLLGSYANSKLPLPSAVAFTLIRTSERLRTAAPGERAPQVAHSDELLQKFTPLYKEATNGGLILPKPKTSLTLAYVPTNPSLDAKKEASNGVVELPNFFEDLGVFDPLVAVWRDFVTDLTPRQPKTAAESLEGRPDFEGFVEALRQGGDDGPLTSTLGALGALMGLDCSTDKVHGGDRKNMVETAQVEGYQILPNLGLPGWDYGWEDPILLLPLELGARLSQDYLAASFLLDLLCALMEVRIRKLFEPLRQRLNHYFSLSTEDNVRLEAQGLLDVPAHHPVERYGELVQFWLQGEDLADLRNFLFDFLSFLPQTQAEEQALRERVCGVLNVSSATPPPYEERAPLERGEALLKTLSPLFRNS